MRNGAVKIINEPREFILAGLVMHREVVDVNPVVNL